METVSGERAAHLRNLTNIRLATLGLSLHPRHQLSKSRITRASPASLRCHSLLRRDGAKQRNCTLQQGPTAGSDPGTSRLSRQPPADHVLPRWEQCRAQLRWRWALVPAESSGMQPAGSPGAAQDRRDTQPMASGYLHGWRSQPLRAACASIDQFHSRRSVSLRSDAISHFFICAPCPISRHR